MPNPITGAVGHILVSDLNQPHQAVWNFTQALGLNQPLPVHVQYQVSSRPQLSFSLALPLHPRLQLLGGQRQVAERLIENLRSTDPGKASYWYAEKAIYDLERDRT